MDSPSTKIKDSNIIIIPKLIINKNNKRNNFNELLEVAYEKFQFNTEHEYDFYHDIFYFYRKNKSNNLSAKIYTIFPNVNFEFKQIKNLSFSNTNLNKFLISSNNQNIENIDGDSKKYLNGFFTMSQNHRLISLKDDIKECGGVGGSRSLREIIFGIWINLKDEQPNENKDNLDELFNKNKIKIFKECFKFIELSNHIETIYSASPEENIFLLVIFYKGLQCHYEVKMTLNDLSDKSMWLISKCKYELSEKIFKVPFDFDLKLEIKHGKIMTMGEFLNKKLNLSKNIKLNDLQKSAGSEQKIKNEKISEPSNSFDLDEQNNNYKDYNLPLAINNISKSENNIKKQKIDLNKKQSQISHASTNAHSKKPSLSLSKNSLKNKLVEETNDNNTNSDNNINTNTNINNNIICNNMNDSISQYTNTIIQNSENIKKLQNQVNKLENNILEIIKELEKEDNQKKKEKKSKKQSSYNQNKNIDKAHDISSIGDISINVPKIIYKELSMTNDNI